jgi:hypothetical protein
LIAAPGAVVFTSTGEEDSPTTPVCATVASYRDYLKENGNKGCVERPAGVKVVIDAIVPATAEAGAIVKVHAQSGAFAGYTAVTELLPPIPSGTVVALVPAPNETLTISSSRRAELDDGINLGARASAVVLQFDPASDGRDLFVRVTNGKYAGKTGWLYSRQAFAGDRPVNLLVVRTAP